MKQYLDLLQTIKEKGTLKPAARENMPSTQSLFGYQFRHNLADGFPLLTTKKLSLKNIVTELLWFLRGDTNIKYLVDNGCNIWNQDAYQYYCKICKEQDVKQFFTFIDFDHWIKNRSKEEIDNMYKIFTEKLGNNFWPKNYTLGDCGFQYGRVWRAWNGKQIFIGSKETGNFTHHGIESIDQIKSLIDGLKNNPESRRHIVTAIDPAHDTDLALYWCHAMFQFNCRPLTIEERYNYANKNNIDWENGEIIPKYYLDCQLYQRSADVFLGVPYNIASYALLTEILAKLCNMIPGEFIHTFGDVHIYENHIDQVNEQLMRIPKELPKLKIMFKDLHELNFEQIENLFNKATHEDFQLMNYDPYPAIKAPLSTGLK